MVANNTVNAIRLKLLIGWIFNDLNPTVAVLEDGNYRVSFATI